MHSYDFVVIGAGPGGYVAAIRAAQHGRKVALIEAGQVGGTCLNVGCVPSKALIESAHVLTLARSAGQFGVQTGAVRLDFKAMMGRQAKIVQGLTMGVAQLLKANGVTMIKGTARLAGDGRVEVAGAAGTEMVEARQILLATGARPVLPPVPGLAELALTTDTVWKLEEQPAELIVIGGGVIGVEFASLFSAIGTKVTLVEMLPRLLPGADGKMADKVAATLRSAGVEILTDARVEGAEQAGPGRTAVQVALPGGSRTIVADCILCAAGRVPRVNREEMAAVGVEVDRKGIRVDGSFATTAPGVYAVGDVIGGGLAHVATAQAIACVDGLFGEGGYFEAEAVPSVVYTLPELAWVGLSEDLAREQGIAYEASTFPYAALGRAHTMGATTGEIKLLCEPGGGRILGLHIFGAQASELIHEGVVAISLGASARDLGRIIHAHPTLSEGILEAAHGAELGPIHFFRRKQAR